MAYYAEWASPTKQGYLYIYKPNEFYGFTKLMLKRDGFSISTNWQEPMMCMTAEFSIMNLETDFFTLLPLLSGKEREYKVLIVTMESQYAWWSEIYSSILFDGFLNCDTVTQKYLHRQSINFVASSYLAKLEYVHPASIDTLQNITFIEIIDEILRSTGADFSIRVNSKLKSEGDTLTTGHTLFDKNGFFTELFWTDNVERRSSLEILKSILISFNCYLYWFDGYWYIERYVDIWSTSVDFVEYGDVLDSSGSDGVVTIAQSVLEVHDLVFTDQSQTMAIIPGAKTVKINLGDQRIENLIINDLTNAVGVVAAFPEPPLRTWYREGAWGNIGESFSILANSISRAYTNDTLDNGISTSFRMSVISEDTKIEIKYGAVIEIGTGTIAVPTLYLLKDYTFKFYWYLREVGPHNFVMTSTAGDNDEEEETDWNLLEHGSTLLALQFVEIEGSSFDKNNKSTEVSITIPMGQVNTFFNGLENGKLTGDHTFVVCIAAVTMCLIMDVPEEEVEVFPVRVRLGDVSITETGDIQDNIIEGTYEPNFVNKEEITLDLYDAISYSYKNAILQGAILSTRTERWGILGGVNQIKDRGVCYSSVNTVPDLTDTHTHNGTGFGVFSSALTGLTGNTLYYTRAYATDGDGNTVYGAVVEVTTLNIVVGAFYEGGWIGYIFVPGDAGYVEGEIHGIIVSAEQQKKDQIGSIIGDPPHTSDANRIVIGGGMANTEAILANPKQGLYGIHYLTAFRTNSNYQGWYLPDYNELKALWVNRALTGGWSNAKYWTSTEPYGWGQAYRYAYAIDFGSSVVPPVIAGGYNNGYEVYWKKTHVIFYFRWVRNF